MRIRPTLIFGLILLSALISVAQEYQPKFPRDPAKSDSEAAALGFMRTVSNAQWNFKKKHNAYAPSLLALVGSGSFTKRMAATTKRGDYTVHYKAAKDGYILTMTPEAIDATHRSFFLDESGKIRASDDGLATENSPSVNSR